MALNAIPEIFENAFEGVNTSVSPDMISQSQIQWGKNLINRGAKPGTRPSWVYRMTLPSGLVQGASYFGVQGGMGVASIAGNIWRLRIGPVNYTAEQINLPWRNSAIVKKVYMQQTVESLVIQDGQSNPIIYNGSTAVRSDPTDGGVPRGTVMAYGNGRLWVAINSKELVAGDIRTNQAGSELKFTETNYLSGGGTLYFPRGITALGFIATTGTSDYGALLVFGLDYTESVRADITFRDLWAQTPGFVTNVLRHTGCASHWSLAEVNQDLYWRDAGGGLRSIRSALADESGPGNAPISREISRLTDYDSPQLLGFSSSISFNNRLITTCSPFLNETHGVSWKDLAPLDFAPMSTMRGKSLPAYDGEWDGLNFTHLFQGQFNGRSRAFGVASNPDGTNALWELMDDGRGGFDDVSVTCTDGSSTALASPITCTLESGARDAGDNKVRKRAERCDVFISDMLGPVNLKVYWRVDNNQKWILWDESVDVCAKNGEPETPGATTHVWKNILSQQRPQIKTFTVPTHIDPITAFALQTGFEFQVRLVWTGQMKIDKFILWLRPLAESPYAIRDVVVANCITNDVTDNEVVYQIPFSPCANTENVPVPLEPFFYQYDGPFEYPAWLPQIGYRYFLHEEIDGTNKRKFAPVGGTVSARPCDTTTGPDPAYGTILDTYSGAVDYNLDNSSVVGAVQAVSYQDGTVTAYDHNIGKTFVYSADNLAALFTLISPVSSRHSVADTGDSYTQIWSTPQHVNGWFPGSLGGVFDSVMCEGHTVTSLVSDLVTVEMLGLPVAREGSEGSDAQTQTSGSFNTSTRVNGGNFSKAKIPVQVDPDREQITGIFTFTVTPSIGDPYTVTIIKDYLINGAIQIDTWIDYPLYENSTVKLVDWEYSYQKVLAEDFESYTEGTHIVQLDASPTWPAVIFFGAPAPNTECWDDFENYPTDVNQDGITLMITGERWAGNAIFSNQSYTEVSDDFEGYAIGETNLFAQGTGWNGPGSSTSTLYFNFWDDFESYSIGSIFVFDFTSTDNEWNGDGHSA